ncbi:MAG TPA: sigma-54 dependent transcriptional regulator [candidate division Zixibacteria bacterium]|nr:sigma-54 dependent transcriptional regulator [candidate division Zixibacteria bacterium]
MPKVLVVEKSGQIHRLLQQRFSPESVSVERAFSVSEAMERFRVSNSDVLVWDTSGSRTEQSRGLEFLDLLAKDDSSKTYIIVVTDQGNSPIRLEHLRGYAHHTLTRPVDYDELSALITQAFHQQAAWQSNGRSETQIPLEFEGMLGISLPMQEVFQRILEAASEDISVLITGETGTGKDMVAAAIHRRSRRRNGPYIAVNTGAISSELIAAELFGREKGAYTGAVESSRGRFEEAHNGTIFLDEISTIDEKAQVSLLRVLETKTFRRVGGERDLCANVRVIAATNENLEEAVHKRKFREDLFYRLDVFHIHVPALRERPGGVTLLTNHFVPHFNAIYKKKVRVVTSESWQCLRRYSWPGNVRELKNVIQRAVLMAKGEELTPDLLPLRIRTAAGGDVLDSGRSFPIHPGMSLQAVEKEYILMTLAMTKGNKKQAAMQLGISRRALYDKLKKHGLNVP